MKKPQTVFEKYKSIQAIGTEVEVPWAVWTTFSENCKKIEILGSQVYLGCDHVTLEQARAAVEFYATQLGGTIKWSAK
jgi:hypothetical protein